MLNLEKSFPRWPMFVLWGLSVLIALASLRFLIADIRIVMEPMAYHLTDRAVWLYAHIGFAPIALAMLPFQFSKKLRTRQRGLHQWMGRLYAVSILIAGTGGVVLAYYISAGLIAASGFLMLSLVWMGTTVVAVYFAITKQITLHRAWIIRSAALTLSAVTLRLYLPIGALTVGFDEAYPIIAWACWVPNLIVAEWLLSQERRIGLRAT